MLEITREQFEAKKECCNCPAFPKEHATQCRCSHHCHCLCHKDDPTCWCEGECDCLGIAGWEYDTCACHTEHKFIRNPDCVCKGKEKKPCGCPEGEVCCEFCCKCKCHSSFQAKAFIGKMGVEDQDIAEAATEALKTYIGDDPLGFVEGMFYATRSKWYASQLSWEWRAAIERIRAIDFVKKPLQKRIIWAQLTASVSGLASFANLDAYLKHVDDTYDSAGHPRVKREIVMPKVKE